MAFSTPFDLPTTFVHSYVLVLGSWVYVYRTSVHVRTCTGTCTCTSVRNGQSVLYMPIGQTGSQASFGEVRVCTGHSQPQRRATITRA